MVRTCQISGAASKFAYPLIVTTTTRRTGKESLGWSPSGHMQEFWQRGGRACENFHGFRRRARILTIRGYVIAAQAATTRPTSQTPSAASILNSTHTLTPHRNPEPRVGRELAWRLKAAVAAPALPCCMRITTKIHACGCRPRQQTAIMHACN